MFKQKRLLLLLLVTVLTLLAVGCTGTKVNKDQNGNGEVIENESKELVIYSGRKEQFILPLLEEFEKETGIKVKLLAGSATEYAHRIIEEKNNPQADIFFSNDAAIMEYLKQESVLQAYDSEAVKQIPENFRAEDNSWIGLSARSRVFMFNKDLILAEDMPQSMFDLTNPKYKGQFAITKAGSEAMVSHIAAVRSVFGDEVTEELIRGIIANEPIIMNGHTDIRKAVGSGEVKFGLVNNYYFHLQLEEDKDNNVDAIYPDQGEGEMGTFVNVAGIAFIKGGKNSENGMKLAEFLLREEQQETFAMVNKETPVLPHIKTLDYAKKVDEYKVANIKLSELSKVWNDTVDLMERAGYAE